MTAATTIQRQRRGDSAGLMLSGICLAHCLAAPAIVAVVPALALGMNHEIDRAVHWTLLAVALPISLWTFRQGLRSHGQGRWLMVGLVGLSFMVAGVLLHTPSHGEMWLTVAGVVILAGAHVMNWLSAARSSSRIAFDNTSSADTRAADCPFSAVRSAEMPARRAA
jgi:hypothetical protein